jgi:hypothetical protein
MTIIVILDVTYIDIWVKLLNKVKWAFLMKTQVKNLKKTIKF